MTKTNPTQPIDNPAPIAHVAASLAAVVVLGCSAEPQRQTHATVTASVSAAEQSPHAQKTAPLEAAFALRRPDALEIDGALTEWGEFSGPGLGVVIDPRGAVFVGRAAQQNGAIWVTLGFAPAEVPGVGFWSGPRAGSFFPLPENCEQDEGEASVFPMPTTLEECKIALSKQKAMTAELASMMTRVYRIDARGVSRVEKGGQLAAVPSARVAWLDNGTIEVALPAEELPFMGPLDPTLLVGVAQKNGDRPPEVTSAPVDYDPLHDDPLAQLRMSVALVSDFRGDTLLLYRPGSNDWRRVRRDESGLELTLETLPLFREVIVYDDVRVGYADGVRFGLASLKGEALVGFIDRFVPVAGCVRRNPGVHCLVVNHQSEWDMDYEYIEIVAVDAEANLFTVFERQLQGLSVASNFDPDFKKGELEAVTFPDGPEKPGQVETVSIAWDDKTETYVEKAPVIKKLKKTAKRPR